MNDISNRRYRANPKYRFIALEDLSESQRQALGEFQVGQDCSGILVPRDGAQLGIKSIDHGTAQLFLALEIPATLSAMHSLPSPENRTRPMASLVADGIIEIERKDRFDSGADAFDLIFTDRPRRRPVGRLATLSRDALRYATSLMVDDPMALSQRLYSFNRIPASPRWKRTLGAPAAVKEYLGIHERGVNRELLQQKWVRVRSKVPYDGWRMWRAADAAYAHTNGSDRTYKLYVSPHCDALPDVFHATLETLAASDAYSLKIGNDVYGLLRPDKLMVYFRDHDALLSVAEQLRRRLDGCAVQGVPFTAALGTDGLLSWGVDPPEEAHLSRRWVESWRFWLTNRLATALIQGRRARTRRIAPWRFAMERLGLEGIDTSTWAPCDSLWRRVAPTPTDAR